MVHASILLCLFNENKFSIEFTESGTDERTTQLLNLFIYSAFLLKVVLNSSNKSKIINFLQSIDTPGKSLALFDLEKDKQISASDNQEAIDKYFFSFEYEKLEQFRFSFSHNTIHVGSNDFKASLILMRYFADKFRYKPGYLDTFSVINNIIRQNIDRFTNLIFEPELLKVLKMIERNLSIHQSPNWQFKLQKQKEINDKYNEILGLKEKQNFKEILLFSYKEILNSAESEKLKFENDLSNNLFPKIYTKKTYRKNMVLAEKLNAELISKLRKLFKELFNEDLEEITL